MRIIETICSKQYWKRNWVFVVTLIVFMVGIDIYVFTTSKDTSQVNAILIVAITFANLFLGMSALVKMDE